MTKSELAFLGQSQYLHELAAVETTLAVLAERLEHAQASIDSYLIESKLFTSMQDTCKATQASIQYARKKAMLEMEKLPQIHISNWRYEDQMEAGRLFKLWMKAERQLRKEHAARQKLLRKQIK